MRGQAKLLAELKALDDLERVRMLFDDLETSSEVIDLLGHVKQAEGVRIFIGAETGCSRCRVPPRSSHPITMRPTRSSASSA